MSERSPQPPDEARHKLDPAHLPVGFMVGGKYEIKRLLGEGANGSVYEGEHTQIGHRVAIKVVHKDLAEREDIVARFRREARICATIRNRHVGQVYDVGELPGGAPFMVMELHEGASLAESLRQGALPIATAVEIGRQLLLGLQAAHEIGAVHRDVKPDNVMLVRETAGQLLVKLVDFGIGKTMVTDLSSRAVTLDGMVVGSPDYMPPEQLKGEAVDQRADLYATGVVLYEMITGQVPFDAASLTELFVAILRDPLVPPRQLRPDCPTELEAIVVRALRRAADERYASAREMEQALVALQATLTLDTSAPARRPDAAARSASRSQLRRVATGEPMALARPATTSIRIPFKRGGVRTALLGMGLLAAGLVFVLAQGRLPEFLGDLQRAGGLEAAGKPIEAHRVVPLPPQQALGAASNDDDPVGQAPASAASQGPSGAQQGVATPAAEAAEPKPGAVRHAPAGREAKTEAARELEPRRGPRSRIQRAQTGVAARVEARAAESTPAAAESQSGATLPVADLVREAAAAFVRGQTPRARALYREAISRAPSNADAWRGLGMVSSRMGERNEAALAFRRYLVLRPDAPDAAAIHSKLDGL